MDQNAMDSEAQRNRIIQMPVYSPEEVIQMIETVSVDPKVKDELTAIIRRSAKLSEQRAALSLSITNICGYSNEARGLCNGTNEERGYVVPEGISYDKSQNRYRTSYKEGKRLVQKVFSIRAHGERKALSMAVEQRKQWIREGKVPVKGGRQEQAVAVAKTEPIYEEKPTYPRTRSTTGSLQGNMYNAQALTDLYGKVPHATDETFSEQQSSLNKNAQDIYKTTGHLAGIQGLQSADTDLFSTNSAFLHRDTDQIQGMAAGEQTPPAHHPLEGLNVTDQSSNDMAYILNAFGTGQQEDMGQAEGVGSQNLNYLTQLPPNLGALAAGPYY